MRVLVSGASGFVGSAQVLFDDALAGAVNAVAPHTVRNGEFTQALARVLGRPAVLPVPAFALPSRSRRDGG